jgi:hypothetical protein
MTPEEFQKVLPFVRDWIDQTLVASASRAKPVASFNFPRLGLYFGNELLTRAKVVFVDKVPVPPLSAIGLRRFADFENMKAIGITYQNTYFLLWHEAERESLHFHELVHVIQWQVLGAERFLALYADGLERHGYRNCPLEMMAYDHEARFDSNANPYAVETDVRRQLAAMIRFNA